ncbi:MAG: hypothetical protein AB1571_01025 [Nanoarchaeota archaeon]
MRFSNKLKKILDDKKYLLEILEEFDIKLISVKRVKEFKNFPRRCLDGFIDYEWDKICIEKSLAKEEQEITLLHEILHVYYDNRGLARNEYVIQKQAMKIWWNKKYN